MYACVYVRVQDKKTALDFQELEIQVVVSCLIWILGTKLMSSLLEEYVLLTTQIFLHPHTHSLIDTEEVFHKMCYSFLIKTSSLLSD